MAEERSNRVNIVLDEDHASKLRRLAARSYVQPGTLARSLLSAALDQVEPDAATITAVLDAIPGAWERAQEGLRDVEIGRTLPIEEL